MSEEADPQQRQSTGPGQPSDQDTGSAVGRDELATQLSELARVLQQEEHSEATLERVVQAAVTLIPGAEEGSISVVTGRSHVESQAPSSDLPRRPAEVFRAEHDHDFMGQDGHRKLDGGTLILYACSLKGASP